MRFLTERGQNVNGQPNIIYVSTDNYNNYNNNNYYYNNYSYYYYYYYVSMDNGVVWNPLHEFLDVRHDLFFIALYECVLID